MNAIDFDSLQQDQQQRSASTYTGRWLRIIAGAGSGKTQTLIFRIMFMIVNVSVKPAAVLAITFSNKASKELQTRLSSLCSKKLKEDITVGTFHSICASILRRHADLLKIDRRFEIIDEKKSSDIISKILKTKQRAHPPNAVINQMQEWKNERLDYRDVNANNIAKTQFEKDCAVVLQEYEAICQKHSYVDFGDLLMLCVKHLRANPEFKSKVNKEWTHIFVDEFQDTNKVQLDLLRHLVPMDSDEHHITIVGDDYQAIHEWRGANVGNFVEFEKYYHDVETIKLETNYRSLHTIVHASSHLIKHNQHQIPKNLVAHNKDTQPITITRYRTDEEECKSIVQQIHDAGEEAWGSTAILLRQNAQSSFFEPFFRKMHIPYVIKGDAPFYKRSEAKDIMSYIRLVQNQHSDEDFLRVCNVPRRGVGKATLDKLKAIAAEKNVSLYESISHLGAKHTGLIKFRQTIKNFANIRTVYSAIDIVNGIIDDFDYLSYLGDVDKCKHVEELKNIVSSYETLDGFLQYVDQCLHHDDHATERSVQLLTLHASKGLEFETVYIPRLCHDCLPHFYAIRDGKIEEERRLFYVGMTRAKRNLHLSYPMERKTNYKMISTTPSIFLDEIPESDVERRYT